jgi:predicted O-methyltransferase YrrM
LSYARVRRAIGRRSTRLIYKRLFPLWERLGFHLIPNHFYEPIPDTRTLKDKLWERRSELVGVEMHPERQLALLGEFVRRFKHEYDTLPQTRAQTAAPHQYYTRNGLFGPIDGAILYCMIRDARPRRVVEVGSGYSTFLIAQAILANQAEDHGDPPTLTVIDPQPREVVRQGFPGLTELRATQVEAVPLDVFQQLEANDVLFIDSSHALRIGGDVQFEYLEVIPRLARGVLVHAHDIFLPGEYPKVWVLSDYRFWTEQYLLQAFLAFNREFEVLWGGAYMLAYYPEKIAQAFRWYEPGLSWAGSFWMRRT